MVNIVYYDQLCICAYYAIFNSSSYERTYYKAVRCFVFPLSRT